MKRETGKFQLKKWKRYRVIMDKDLKQITDNINNVVERFSKNTEQWQELKKDLEMDISSMKELIILIDKAVKLKEETMSKLN